MGSKPLVMIVEDDGTISNFISVVLVANDFKVITVTKGREAISMAASHCPDLVLLDLGLPDMDGIEVLKKIREWTGLPVIIVSARGQESEKVNALDSGADDYIAKPFGTSELLARIRTAIRHSRNITDNHAGVASKLALGELEIDYARRIVAIEGEEIHLTPIEYKIIVLLSTHLGKVMTYDSIMKEIWGPYSNERLALRVNMANIRRKLETNPGEPKYIVTEVGVGYRMVEEIQ
jgi:two-component system, OmpR family, KDP operon response regulator KdpE